MGQANLVKLLQFNQGKTISITGFFQRRQHTWVMAASLLELQDNVALRLSDKESRSDWWLLSFFVLRSFYVCYSVSCFYMKIEKDKILGSYFGWINYLWLTRSVIPFLKSMSSDENCNSIGSCISWREYKYIYEQQKR